MAKGGGGSRGGRGGGVSSRTLSGTASKQVLHYVTGRNSRGVPTSAAKIKVPNVGGVTLTNFGNGVAVRIQRESSRKFSAFIEKDGNVLSTFTTSTFDGLASGITSRTGGAFSTRSPLD